MHFFSVNKNTPENLERVIVIFRVSSRLTSTTYFLLTSTVAGVVVVSTGCCCCCWQETRAAAVRARIAMVFIMILTSFDCLKCPVLQE